MANLPSTLKDHEVKAELLEVVAERQSRLARTHDRYRKPVPAGSRTCRSPVRMLMTALDLACELRSQCSQEQQEPNHATAHQIPSPAQLLGKRRIHRVCLLGLLIGPIESVGNEACIKGKEPAEPCTNRILRQHQRLSDGAGSRG